MPLAGEERFAILDRLVAALRPDGVFLVPPLSDDAQLLQRLSELKLPCARIAGSVMAESFNIPTPERAAGRMVAEDRKSVVEGTSVSVRVNSGGRGIIKKKKYKTRQLIVRII